MPELLKSGRVISGGSSKHFEPGPLQSTEYRKTNITFFLIPDLTTYLTYIHWWTEFASVLEVLGIDQVWGQDGWILAKFFFCVFMDRDEHKIAKKERGQYLAILTEQTWSIKDLLYGFWGKFACGIQRVVPSG